MAASAMTLGNHNLSGSSERENYLRLSDTDRRLINELRSIICGVHHHHRRRHNDKSLKKNADLGGFPRYEC